MEIIGGRENSFVANTAAIVASTFTSPLHVTKIVTTSDKTERDNKIERRKQESQRTRGQQQQQQVQGDGEPERIPQLAEADSSALTGSQVGPEGPAPIFVTPVFKLVFLSILAVTVLSGLVQLLIASEWANPNPNQQATFESFGFAWKAGLGAIFGLLGGKVT